MSLHIMPEPKTGPMKTRYTIIDPVPETEPGTMTVDPKALESMVWVDCEFKNAYPTYEELSWLLDPHFPDAEGWERVAVNSFKGPTDMFVDDTGALKSLPVNGIATLIYWTASLMHKLAESDRSFHIDIDASELRIRALLGAADLITVDPAHTPPRIHGRAVLFEDRVWF